MNFMAVMDCYWVFFFKHSPVLRAKHGSTTVEKFQPIAWALPTVEISTLLAL
jgi:hypothetical protein